MSYNEYIKKITKEKICPFCKELSLAIDANDTAFVLPARAPYTIDHLLICPKEHKKSLSELSVQELQDIQELMLKWSEIIKKEHGELVVFLRQWLPFWLTGQTVAHLHWHIVPNFPIHAGWSQDASDSRKFLDDEEYAAILERTRHLQDSL